MAKLRQETTSAGPRDAEGERLTTAVGKQTEGAPVCQRKRRSREVVPCSDDEATPASLLRLAVSSLMATTVEKYEVRHMIASHSAPLSMVTFGVSPESLTAPETGITIPLE